MADIALSKNFKRAYAITNELIEKQYNHVHHANIIRLLERARIDYLESIGHPIESFFAKGLFIVIYSIGVQFKREILLGEVEITCENSVIAGKQLLMEQRIINEKGKEAATAKVDLRIISRKLGKSITWENQFA